MKYARGEETVDLQGIDVFQFRTVKVAKLTLECLACGKTFGAGRKQMRIPVDFILESLDYRIHSPKNRHEMIYVNPSGGVWFSD